VSIELPAGLAGMFSLLSGQKWPEGDEDKLYAMGEGLIGIGRQFSDVSGRFNAASGHVLANIGGAPANEFYNFSAQLQGSLPTMSETSVELGTMSRNMGSQVEYAKYMIIAQLVWLSYEIAQWLVFLPEAVPLFVEAADLAVAAILRRLLAAAAAGGVSMSLMDLAIQGLQKLKGDRSGIDWASTLGSFEAGAVAGAVGGAVFTFGSKAVGAVAKSALSDSSVVKKIIDSVDDPQQLETVVSGLSTASKAGLGAASTVEKTGLGVVNGVATSGAMSAAFGGPDETGLSAAAGAAGMLTGERRGTSHETDSTDSEPPPVVDLSQLDNAAAALTTPDPVTDPLGVTGTGGGPGETTGTADTPSDSSTATETNAPAAALTTETGALPTGIRGGTGTQTTHGGAPVEERDGVPAQRSAGAADGRTAPAATAAPITENPKGSGGGTTTDGGGVTTVGHAGAGGTSDTGGVVTPEGAAGARDVPPEVVTEPSAGAAIGQAPGTAVAGGVRGEPSTVGGGLADPAAGGPGVHSASVETTPTTGQSARMQTESSGPAPTMTGQSRAGHPASAGVTAESGTGANPAAASGGVPGRPEVETGSAGAGVSRPVTESSASVVASPDLSAGVPPVATADRGLGQAGPVEPVATGESRAGLPDLDPLVSDQPAPGHTDIGHESTAHQSTADPSAGQQQPAPRTRLATKTSAGGAPAMTEANDTRGTHATGDTRDAAGEVAPPQPTTPGRTEATGGPVNDESGDNAVRRTVVESSGPDLLTKPLARLTPTESGPDTGHVPASRDPAPTDPPRPGPTESRGPRPGARASAADPARVSDPPRTADPTGEGAASAFARPSPDYGRASIRDTETGQPEDVGTTTGSGTDRVTHRDDRPLDDVVMRDPVPIRTAGTASQRSPDSEMGPRPNRHAAEHPANADTGLKPLSPEKTPSTIESANLEPRVATVSGPAPHPAAPSHARDLSGDHARSDDASRRLDPQPTRMRLSDLVSEVNRAVLRLTKETGDAENHLPTNVDVVRIYRGLDGWKKRGTPRDIGERIAEIHLTGSEFKLHGGVDYRLIHRKDRKNIVESNPNELLWHFSNINDPRRILKYGFTPRGDVENAPRLWKMQIFKNEPGAFISTTRNRDLWDEHDAYAARRYRFEIHSIRNNDPIGVDMDATNPRAFALAFSEDEVAFTGGIDPAAVISVYDRKRDRTGYWNQQRDDVDWIPGDQQNLSVEIRATPAASTSGPPVHHQVIPGYGANAHPGTSSHATHAYPQVGVQPWGPPSGPSAVYPVPHAGQRPWGISGAPFPGYGSPYGYHPPGGAPGPHSPYLPPSSTSDGNDNKKKSWKFWKKK